MRKLILVFVIILAANQGMAQIHEIGIFAGGNNYIGDIGPTNYISPNNLAIGAVYKWNRSPRYSFRASFTYGKLEASDADADIAGRKARGYNFENSVKELSVGVEFNFLDFNLHEERTVTTPYLYSGVSYFGYDTLVFENGSSTAQVYGTHNTFAIPMVIGVKTNISRRLILAAEIGARYTFTDDLDGSNPVKDKAEFDSLKFGNINSDDWYVFSGITVTYTFGKKPCYCGY